MDHVTGSTRLVREINESLILDALRRGPASRAGLVRSTGLTSGTVSNLVSRLAQQGLITELGQGPSTGGRKPVLLQLNSRARLALGVHLTPESVHVVLVDLSTHPIGKASAPLPGGRRPDIVFELIASMTHRLLEDYGASADRVLGLGAAVPATVDVDHGLIILAPNLLGWEDVPVKDVLEKHLGLPVVVDNDANSAAHGELWCGLGSQYRDFVFVYADYGIGAGLVVGGEVHRGRYYAAGEVGHSVIDVHGPLCHCGRRGCLGTVAAGRYLVDGKPFLTVQELLAAAGHQNARAVELLDHAGRYLGVALANLINVYSPEAIILGGRLALESPTYREAAVRVAQQETFKPLRGRVQFLESALGGEACALGAASLVLRSFFRPYRVTREVRHSLQGSTRGGLYVASRTGFAARSAR